LSAPRVDREHQALLADSVALALLAVLEPLSPAEQLAFVLHDMLGVPFDEIAPIVERSPRRHAVSARHVSALCTGPGRMQAVAGYVARRGRAIVESGGPASAAVERAGDEEG
jgi:hypothetical protein